MYWISDAKPPTNITNSFYFNIDEVQFSIIKDLDYQPFYLDFGPLNLGKAWKYVSELEKLISIPDYKKNKIYHYTSTENAKSANAAFLMGAFQVRLV